jgi:hypothetical protein
MKALLLTFLVLTACDRPKPDKAYFLSKTIEREDGSVLTVIYSGPIPPREFLHDLTDSNTP